MKKVLTSLVVALVGVSGCGGKSGSTCGPGTVEKDGTCVPVEVAPPCGDGTVFDDASKTCVIVCGDEATRMGAMCVPIPVMPNVTGKENDDPQALGTPNDVTLPSGEGEDLGALIIAGNVDAMTDLNADGVDDIDYDFYKFTAHAGTVLRISAESDGDPSPAFSLQGDPNDTHTAGYSRFGLNVVGGDAERQVYIPTTGDYLLIVSDVANFESVPYPVGGEGLGYFVSIEVEEAPEPTAIAAGDEMTVDSNEVRLFSIDADASSLFLAQLTTEMTMLLPAMQVIDDATGNVIAALSGNSAKQPDTLVGSTSALVFGGGTLTIVLDYDQSNGDQFAFTAKLDAVDLSTLDEREPNDENGMATVIDPMTATATAVLGPDDVDVFSYTAAADGKYAFVIDVGTLTGIIGVPDTIVDLIDKATGVSLVDAEIDTMADDIFNWGIPGWDDLFSEVDKTLVAGQEVYLVVKKSDKATAAAAVGDYSVLVKHLLPKGTPCDPMSKTEICDGGAPDYLWCASDESGANTCM